MKAKLMTKLALAAAVVCAAAASKAANLAGNMYWTVEGVESTSGKPMTDSTPYTAYYFYLLDSWSAADLNSKMADIESRIVNRDVSSLASSDLSVSYSQHLNTQTSSTGSFTDNFATYRATSVFSVIINAASLADATKYMFAKTSDGSYYMSVGQTQNGDNKTVRYYSFGDQSVNGAVWQTIPEPTSGVLLALGVAVLALRRKKAA